MIETGFGPIAILSEPVVAPAGGHPRPQTWSEGGKDNRISRDYLLTGHAAEMSKSTRMTGRQQRYYTRLGHCDCHGPEIG